MDNYDPYDSESELEPEYDVWEDPLEERRRALLARSGLAEHCWNDTLEPGKPGTLRPDWRLASATHRLRAWVSTGGVLYLYGDEARTALARAAAVDCIRKECPEQVRFVAEGDLFWMVTVRNIKNLRDEFRLSTYEDAGVLVLEGVGVRRLNDYMRDVLFDLFRQRFRSGMVPRKTLLTGRPPPEGLEEWLRGNDSSKSGTELVTMFREVVRTGSAVGLIPPPSRS